MKQLPVVPGVGGASGIRNNTGKHDQTWKGYVLAWEQRRNHGSQLLICQPEPGVLPCLGRLPKGGSGEQSSLEAGAGLHLEAWEPRVGKVSLLLPLPALLSGLVLGMVLDHAVSLRGWLQGL